jgi:hypothetical protein
VNRIINRGELFWENAQQAWKGALPGMGLEGITLGSKVSANGPLRVFRESKSLTAGLEKGAIQKMLLECRVKFELDSSDFVLVLHLDLLHHFYLDRRPYLHRSGRQTELRGRLTLRAWPQRLPLALLQCPSHFVIRARD